MKKKLIQNKRFLQQLSILFNFKTYDNSMEI